MVSARALALLVPILLLLHGTASSQLGKPTGISFDLRARLRLVTGLDYTLFGVARDTNDEYWVTAQRATASGKHKLFKFDSSGAYRAGFDQPPATDASPSGIYDLAYDPQGNVLYGGCEHAASGRRVFAFDVATSRFESSREWIVPQSAPGSAVRALAFDPFGNFPQGSLWTADLGSPICEFARDGTLLRQLPSVNPLATGAALDPTQRVVWWLGQAGTARTNCKVGAVAMDITTGAANGQVFLGDLSLAGSPPGGLAAGCEFLVYNHLDHIVARIVMVAQAQSHHVYEVEGRFNHGTGCGGRIGFRSDAAYVGNQTFALTLAGSSAQNAYLLLGVQDTTLPMPAPPFGSGCYLLASVATPWLIVGPTTIQSGAASFGLPITLGAGSDLFCQWIEVAPSAPILLSDGGALHLFP